ncbi:MULTISPECIES: hypothetical protein [Enterobacteriaceae]|uniref:hypothetical protein n=1 Tax=Enterobacteriaceae TaxID=543 RepID=UPI0009C97B89|nr:MULTISPECIES: hypothetical protein [Enterobacteriaceae]HCW0178955.1 hypothetical protein [Citrobacter freundii]ELA1511631.1 hypothetical protein [Klebsiella pneumoniae]KAA5796387.1 hypothetical protein F3G52_06890 [Klebsiella pneumoniae]MBC4792162.1 hypothetical protein [Klebsiella pneumoniae]MBL1868789.1 hypothetical protein [Klebsiella pneumoniae]
MSETVTVIDAMGRPREVTVIARFSEKIGGQQFGFVLHKALTVNRTVLCHAASGVRIEILKGSDVERMGEIEAGKKVLQSIIQQFGDEKVASWLSSFLKKYASEI